MDVTITEIKKIFFANIQIEIKDKENGMGIFKKNENEVLYNGGEKHIIEAIKNTGSGEFLIWKQPEEDFNTNSKLIVMPGEQAIFVDGGNVVQVFEEGTYQLETKNYPFISRLKNVLSGGISSFNCVVYFFRKADSKEFRWGTDSVIQVRDKVYGIRTDVRARGTYKVRIENPVLFLEKLVGSNVRFQEQEELDQYFRGQTISKIKSAVSRFLNEYQNELIGIDAYLSEISETIQPSLNDMFAEYGLSCVNFSIMAIDVDKSKYDDIDTAQVASLKRIKEAQGEQGYMETLGGNWDKMQQAKILNNLAQNEAAGGLGMMGAGLGVGVAAGNTFGNMANRMIGNAGGESNPQPQDDPVEILSKLKKMLDAGLIEKSEYDQKKTEVLSRM